MPAETIDTSKMIIRDARETDTVLAFDELGNMFKARLPTSAAAPDVPVDALVINDQPSLTVVAGQDLSVTLGPKQNNGKTVSYSVTGSGAASLTMIDSNTGTFNSSTVAAQVINVAGDDGSGGTDTGVITINVTAVVVNPPANAAPVINDQNLTATEGQNLVIDLGGSDADGDSLTYTLTGAGAANYTESTNSTGIFNSAVVGTEVINVTVSDGTATDTAVITIAVTSAALVGATYSVASGEDIRTGMPQIKTAHVFIESGQSNSQGVAARADAPVGSDPGPIAGVQTWRRSQDGDMYSGIGQWYPLDYEYNQYEGRDQFGSVLKFGLNISDYLHDENNDIYIIKADGNGKAIAGWLDGGAEQGAMYNHINNGLASLVADPEIDEIKIHGFYFDQGESDSENATLAGLHESQLNRLVAELRTNLGLPNLHVIIRQLDASIGYSDVNTVIAGQNSVADNDENIHIIKGPYTYNNDNLHLNGASQNLVGDQRFNTITSVTKGQIYNG